MARKHRRRTRKRGGSVMAKIGDGFKGLDDLRKRGQQTVMDAAKKTQESVEHIRSGYSDRVEQGGMLSQPPSSYLNPETGKVTETPMSKEPIKEIPLPPLQMGETNQPSKEIKGGLLGLGTWFGLGGRRLSHSAFINKMLRVRNKTKRNKAIRKYLKGGKRKRKTKRRRGGMDGSTGATKSASPSAAASTGSTGSRSETLQGMIRQGAIINHGRRVAQRLNPIGNMRRDQDRLREATRLNVDPSRLYWSNGWKQLGGRRKRRKTKKKRRRRR
tara:strand:+ start:653 stop:1468 length:816 start_codon:yes stop_codon:yes gene_type:complete